KRRIPCLRVDGGASANDFLMQFQANISNTAVFRPSVQEATAAGAAYLAGLAVGFYSDRAELTALNSEGRRFTPDMPAEERKALLSGWSRAVSAARV
ncbi:MAG: glycerol kinase, partial [Clostridia bacterium]|nr:glycerol kinase [Clostridia bacterium]